MGDISQKWDRFLKYFIEYEGYKRVQTGLKNTLIIAVLGLLFGTLIGTLIAAVRVMPKYKGCPGY